MLTCVSVHLSVTSWSSTKTAQHRIMMSTLYNSSGNYSDANAISAVRFWIFIKLVNLTVNLIPMPMRRTLQWWEEVVRCDDEWTTLNNLLLKKMKQTHIRIQTYRNNERVTNEFLCKTVLCVGSWNPWPRSRKLWDTQWSGKRWFKQCDGIHILLKRSWVDLEITSSTVIIRSIYP